MKMSKVKSERRVVKNIDMVKEVKEVKTQQPKKTEKTESYITYFQSVTTVGIVSSGKNAKEAQSKSELKMKNSDMTCGVIAHEPFTVSSTDKWEPDFSGIVTPKQIMMDVSDSIREKIANKLKVIELTDNECLEYMRSILEKSLSN